VGGLKVGNYVSLKEHLLQLEEKLLKPEIRTSSEEISKLLTDDFFEFGSSGNVWLKSDCVGPGGLGIVDTKLQDFNINLLSDDVVLTTYRIIDGASGQQTLRSSIWKHQDGRWQMFFHQGTPKKSLQ
jgi:hypothetical protein